MVLLRHRQQLPSESKMPSNTQPEKIVAGPSYTYQQKLLKLKNNLPNGLLYQGFGWEYHHSYPRRCKTSSIGQNAGLSVPRSSVRFRQKTQNPENSNLYGFEVHRPSSKGTKLLFQVIKAIIKQIKHVKRPSSQPLKKLVAQARVK